MESLKNALDVIAKVFFPNDAIICSPSAVLECLGELSTFTSAERPLQSAVVYLLAHPSEVISGAIYLSLTCFFLWALVILPIRLIRRLIKDVMRV